jgi:hypothetical protein
MEDVSLLAVVAEKENEHDAAAEEEEARGPDHHDTSVARSGNGLRRGRLAVPGGGCQSWR